MSIQIFNPEQLSNEAYQALPQVSGSGLFTIYDDNPAQFKFGEPEEGGKALEFGIQSHAMILEPERFAGLYAKDFDASVYERILVTGADMTAYLKELGVKSSGAKAELIQRIQETGEQIHIFDVEQQKYRDSLPGREFIKVEQFEKLERMRAVMLADPDTAAMLAGGFAEYSLVSDEFKVRPDLITSGEYLVNYKTTISAHPKKFGMKAHDYGYLLKAALECEMFRAAYGHKPRGYVLLSQQKHAPFIVKPWRLSRELMAIGEAQLADAVRLYRHCRDNDVWPALGGLEDMTLPDFIMARYAQK